MSEKKNESEFVTEKNENEIANRETEGLSQGQIILRRFVKHKAAMASLVSLLGIIFFVFTASGIHLGTKEEPISVPGWWPYSITDIDPAAAIELTCNGGVTGCPTLDVFPEFIDGTGVQI